jgi:hypothetical protein
MSKDDYTDVILEEIREHSRAVLEAVGDMQQHVAKIPTIEHDVAELTADMKVIKAAVLDTNNQVQKHEHRLTAIETTK